MNYYEHHLGDYLRDTAHLSMLEDGAYRRLLDAYYIKERPLPHSPKEVYRLVRAASKLERDAVQTVLTEFFEETREGWRQRRCDAEINRFNEKAPDREARRDNERDRQRRSRERRRQLFQLLREHGLVPAYDASMAELQSLVEKVATTGGANDEVASSAQERPVTRRDSVHVTRDATGTHPPDASHQTPDKGSEDAHAADIPPRTSAAAEACIALRDAGIGQVNPGDPRLLALLAQGATTANFVSAAGGATGKRNPFAYLLATVQGQLAEAASIASAPRANRMQKTTTRTERRAATIAALTGSKQESDYASRLPSVETAIDVHSHVVG